MFAFFWCCGTSLVTTNWIVQAVVIIIALWLFLNVAGRFGDEVNVDTLPMRRAIWNYIHCIKGIFHDDYSYSEVSMSVCHMQSLCCAMLLVDCTIM